MGCWNRARRLLQIPKKRLIKKIVGFDEIYTIAIRKRDKKSLFEGGRNTFYCIPYLVKYWFADPIIYRHESEDYLFVEAYDRTIAKGHIAVARMNDNPKKIVFEPVIEEKYHMSFPMVFDWCQDIYMIPETSENFSINLYRAIEFPLKWECIRVFETKKKIVDSIILKKETNRLHMLASEINPCNSLEVRFLKYLLEYRNDEWILKWDDAFNSLQTYNLKDRNAGKCFMEKNSIILPTQVSTSIDYGVSLSFIKIDGNSWIEKGKATPNNVLIEGIRGKNIIGIHSYSRTDRQEIIDARYMKFSPTMQWKKLVRRTVDK